VAPRDSSLRRINSVAIGRRPDIGGPQNRTARPDHARYGFGEVRVATLALLIFTVLSG
jgi:hypothetical protein